MQKGKPITFPCQALSIKHQGLPTYGEELIDLSLAVIKCRQHVHLFHFIIKIDHFSLKYLRTQTLSQREGLAELLELSYEIHGWQCQANAGNTGNSLESSCMLQLLVRTQTQ